MEEMNKIGAVFEVSFEAGHKVGGIFTVLKSKSNEVKNIYGDKYTAIGFYDSKSALEHFEGEKAPKELQRIFEELKNEGINAYYGKWITANDVRLILLETREFREKGVWFKEKEMTIDRNVNLIKKRLWEYYGIDSLNTGIEYDVPLAWSWAAGKLIEKICKQGKCEPVVAHFHEWLSGAGLLYLKKNYPKLGLVFTTHATRLGRALSSANIDVHKLKSCENDLKQAEKLHVKAQHMLEKACAREAHVFTTVSEVVANEAKCVLGIEPHIITPNALDFSEYPTMEKVIARRRALRLKMKKFLLSYFSSYYPIKITDCVIFYTLGRYEFHNKGIDLYIDALGKLNEKLKNLEGKHNPVYAFIWVPRKNNGVKEEVEENLLAFDRINDLINEEMRNIKENILINTLKDKPMTFKIMCGEEFSNELKAASRAFTTLRKGKIPPLCAFEINEKQDTIMRWLKKNKLLNRPEDPVKVIFYPEYLSAKDPILGMDVNDAVMSCTMGVFPSRYEPWGMTIMEAGALLALGVTTNASGAGAFIKKLGEGNTGLKVLELENKSDSQISEELSEIMKEVVLMDKDLLLESSIKARNIAEQSDWRIQIKNYVAAYNMALKKLFKD